MDRAQMIGDAREAWGRRWHAWPGMVVAISDEPDETVASFANPAMAASADEALDCVDAILRGLDEPCMHALYAALHARGCRITPGSYTEDFRRRWPQVHRG